MDVASKHLGALEVTMYVYRGKEPFTEDQVIASKRTSEAMKQVWANKPDRTPWNKGMTGIKTTCTICKQTGHNQNKCPTLVTVRII